MTVERPASFAELVGFNPPAGPAEGEAHGTTVLALRYDEGALILADRRATMGNLIMYDHAEKVVPLDDATVIAISGAFARSIEICRYLQHAFKYYERMNMSQISVDGKLMEISRALAGNLSMAMQGIGVFLPIVAAYDSKSDEFGVYFFDTAGARFQNAEYACAGSGSERIRGVFEYVSRTGKPWPNRTRREVLIEALRMLDIASDLDSATGGLKKVLPSAYALTRQGARPVPADEIERCADKVLSK